MEFSQTGTGSTKPDPSFGSRSSPSKILGSIRTTMMKSRAFSARIWRDRSAAVPGGRNVRIGRGMGFIESSWTCGPCCARGRAHSVRWAVRSRTDAPQRRKAHRDRGPENLCALPASAVSPDVSCGCGASRVRSIGVHPWVKSLPAAWVWINCFEKSLKHLEIKTVPTF
jgi:hypothetical protein